MHHLTRTHSPEYDVNAAELQVAVTALLKASFTSVSRTAEGGILVAFPDNPVHCYIGELPDGTFIVDLESPVFLDVPQPEPDVYELICLLQHDIAFGSLAVVSSARGGIHLIIRAQLLTDGMTSGQLARAVRVVQREAMAEIHRFRQLAPPLGGETARRL
jgi:hypothetical protein